ncbi:hypothetical protein K2X33_13365 [bacterium]|nr:hypothetical protein [bacterium]
METMEKVTQHTTSVGQAIDELIAEHVMHHHVIRQKKGTVRERTEEGHIRPLRKYSKEMNAAWDVARKMRITLIPIQGHSWFAFVGKPEGWESPGELLQYMARNEFAEGGAAVQENAPLAICLAALTAVQSRQKKKPETEPESLAS